MDALSIPGKESRSVALNRTELPEPNPPNKAVGRSRQRLALTGALRH